MSGARDEQVRERAYQLWEKEGSPHGRDQEFWERARLMVEAEGAVKAGGTSSAPSKDESVADQALIESFPASDPPSFTAEVGAGSGGDQPKATTR